MKKTVLYFILLVGSVACCFSPLYGAQDSKNINSMLSLLLSGKMTGVFIDSETSGLRYRTSSGVSGRTNANGEFHYNPGDTIEFFIGDFHLGSIETGALVSVLDMDNPEKVAMLLQSLDSDHIPGNGITIALEDDLALQAFGNDLGAINPDADSFTDAFERLTGNAFVADLSSSLQHARESFTRRVLDGGAQSQIYAFYEGDMTLPDDARYDRDTLAADADARVQLYFWEHLLKPYMELVQTPAWATINDDSSRESIAESIKLLTEAASASNILSGTHESLRALLDVHSDHMFRPMAAGDASSGSMDTFIDDFITNDVLPGISESNPHEHLVRTFINDELKLLLPCVQEMYGDRQAITQCMDSSNAEFSEILVVSSTEIAPSQTTAGDTFINNYKVAMAWLDSLYKAGSNESMAAKLGTVSSLSVTLEAVKSTTLDAATLSADPVPFDLLETQTIISSIMTSINARTLDFFAQTGLPRDISQDQVIDFEIHPPFYQNSNNTLSVCYFVENLSHDTQEATITFTMPEYSTLIFNPTLPTTNTGITLLQEVTLDLEYGNPSEQCVNMVVSNYTENNTNEIQLQLSIDYGKKEDDGTIGSTTTVTTETSFPFAPDFQEIFGQAFHHAADMLVSTPETITVFPGATCILTLNHDFEMPNLFNSVSYSWQLDPAHTSYEQVSINRSTSARANFVAPDLPPGSNQATLYFTVTVNAWGGEVTKHVQVIVASPPEDSETVAVPGNLVATPGDGSIQFNWEPINNADNYRIYISDIQFGADVNLNSLSHHEISGATTTWTENDASNGTTYYAIVTAVKNSHESVPSQMVTVTPMQGQGLPQ